MKPLPHIVASGIISILSIAYFRSIGYAAISFMAGILIDADHIVDYYMGHGFTFDITKIYNCCIDMSLKRLYLVFHSYELMALLWAAIYIFSLSMFWQAIALGLTQHLVLDQVTNPVLPFGYFFIYRAINVFNPERILKGWKG